MKLSFLLQFLATINQQFQTGQLSYDVCVGAARDSYQDIRRLDVDRLIILLVESAFLLQGWRQANVQKFGGFLQNTNCCGLLVRTPNETTHIYRIRRNSLKKKIDEHFRMGKKIAKLMCMPILSKFQVLSLNPLIFFWLVVSPDILTLGVLSGTDIRRLRQDLDILGLLRTRLTEQGHLVAGTFDGWGSRLGGRDAMPQSAVGDLTASTVAVRIFLDWVRATETN